MASLIPTSSDAVRSRPSGRVLVFDRSKAFEKARRHSLLVRAMRIVLPLASIGMVAAYVTIVTATARLSSSIERKGQVTSINRELAMDNPRYEGITKDGGKFLVAARSAVPDLGSLNRIKLNQIAGDLTDVRRATTEFKAERGLFDTKTNLLELSGGVTVATATGIRAELDTATIATREGTLRSENEARVTAPQGTIRSDRLQIDQKAKRVAFIDRVVANLKPPAPSADAANRKPAGTLPGLGRSGAPIDVTANRLDIDDAAKTAIFTGQVRAGQGGPVGALAGAPASSTIETERLEIAYAGSAAGGRPADSPRTDPPSGAVAPTGEAAPSGAGAASTAARIERIVAPSPVVLTQANGARVTANGAEFDAIGEIAVVAGNVVMTAGADRRATSERAEFNQKADTILLTGNVVVVQGTNELRGRRLFVDRQGGRTDLSSPAEGDLARSRIFARLTQSGAKQKAPRKPALQELAPAAAQDAAAGLGFATFKTDPNAPIDVEADRLQVDDTRKEATFTGDVRAAQADFQIRSAELKATYVGEIGLAADPTGAQTAGAGGKAATQLSRIDAKGKVVVTSKAAQQVTGDWAVFDTTSNTVTVGGADVVLTQGPNVVKGNKLAIDMATGQSVMTRESGAVAGGSSATGAKPGRSSVIFYPSSQEKAFGRDKTGAKPGTSQPGTSQPGAAPAAGGPSESAGSEPKSSTPPKPASSSWGASADPLPN